MKRGRTQHDLPIMHSVKRKRNMSLPCYRVNEFTSLNITRKRLFQKSLIKIIFVIFKFQDDQSESYTHTHTATLLLKLQNQSGHTSSVQLRNIARKSQVINIA